MLNKEDAKRGAVCADSTDRLALFASIFKFNQISGKLGRRLSAAVLPLSSWDSCSMLAESKEGKACPPLLLYYSFRCRIYRYRFIVH